MERYPQKEQKEQKIASERIESLGTEALNAVTLQRLSENPAEDEMMLNFLLSRSPKWTKSEDGHWLYNPIDHKAEYEN